MNTPLRRHECDSAVTWLDVLGLVIVFGVLILIGFCAFPNPGGWMVSGPMSEQLNNGRQIYLAMRGYASDRGHEDVFPAFRDPETKTGLFTNSNEAFEVLLTRYLDDKRPFFNKQSAWCRVTGKSKDTEHKVLPGENDWVYVRGLRVDSPSRWPILANAFAPGTLHYVADPTKPGGVWKGKNAVVIWAGGSAEITEPKQQGDGYFVKRSSDPKLHAFAKDGEWLAGEHVEVLFPLPPTALK